MNPLACKLVYNCRVSHKDLGPWCIWCILCILGSILTVSMLVHTDQTHIFAGWRFSSPQVATGPAHYPHVISGNYLSLFAGIMIYNYNNNNSAKTMHNQAWAHWHTVWWETGAFFPLATFPSLSYFNLFSPPIRRASWALKFWMDALV